MTDGGFWWIWASVYARLHKVCVRASERERESVNQQVNWCLQNEHAG